MEYMNISDMDVETEMDDEKEDLERVTEEQQCLEDSIALNAQLQYQQHILSIKTKWLMGLDLTVSEQEKLNSPDEIKYFPESFLRKDDVHYDNLKAYVTTCFAALNCGRDADVNQDSISTFNLSTDIRQIQFMLDSFNPTGLELIARSLVGNLIEYAEPKPISKRVIRQHLPGLLKNRKDGKEKTRVKELREIMKDPKNFTIEFLSKVSIRDDAVKIRDRLKDLDTTTLCAMRRKLNGYDYTPRLKTDGWHRKALITNVRNKINEFLPKSGENSELPESLAKAMEVASLASRLIQGSPSMGNFRRFSSEIIALQNEIAKAIRIVANKDGFGDEELNGVLKFFAEADRNSFSRKAVKKLLEEFLLECSDLDPIPEFLLKIVEKITSRSAPPQIFSVNEIEEEVENVLCVSAQLKQVLWDLLPEEEYNEDFADAYMEDLTDSDEEDYYHTDSSGDDTQGVFSGGSSFGSREGCDYEEATGETSPVQFEDFSDTAEGRYITKTDMMKFSDDDDQSLKENMTLLKPSESHFRTTVGSLSSRLQSGDNSKTNHAERPGYSVNPEKSSDLSSSKTQDKLLAKRNHYLDVQEACDRNSVVAHRLIGSLLGKFAESEGLHLDSAEASYLRGDNLPCNVARGFKMPEDILRNNPVEDVSWLCSLSEAELDLLIVLKQLAIRKAKAIGHVSLARKFDLKTLRALSFILMEHLKGKVGGTSAIPGLIECKLLGFKVDENFSSMSVEELCAYISVLAKERN